MLNTSNQPSSPRSLAVYNGKVYITLFDGHVAQLDTTSLLIEKTISVGSNPDGIAVANNKLYVANTGGLAAVNDSTISVGSNPEGIAVANNKLYVANSGGLGAVKDSTISVIDPVSFTVTGTFKVVINPVIIKADIYGDLYVISFGNYTTIPYTLQRIDATTGKVSVITGQKPYNLAIEGDIAYMYGIEYDAQWNPTIKTYTTYNVKNEQVVNVSFISTSAIANTPYSIDVNPITKDIYIGETDYTNTGKMNVFGQDGTLKFSFATGVNPRKTIFLSK